MKVLQNIKSEHVVSIDIETVRVADNFEELSEGFQSAWEYKNKQDGEIPDYDVLVEKWQKNSALYAEFSKVCAVSLTYLNPQGLPVCKEFYGEDEKSLLDALKTTLNNMVAYSRDYRLVGHAAKYFDYPFLSKRYIINGLDIPTALDSSNLKPWDGMNLCTNDLWKLGGTGAGSSLQALCNCLNIPISKVDLVGDQVGKAYYDREFSRIGRYCSLDTIATFNVIRRFKKEPIFSFEEVEYITAYSEDIVIPKEVEKETLLLERLYQSNLFTPEIKEQLQDIAKQDLTVADKENIKKIILAHYQTKKDKVAVRKEKELEVDKFIQTL